MDTASLDSMSQVDFQSADLETLVDLQTVKIDTHLPAPERLQDYLAKIENPYCFRVGKTVVKLRFSPDGKSLENGLKSYFSGLKE